MNLSIQDLIQIIANGGGVEIDAANYSTQDLSHMAANARNSGAHLVFYNAQTKSTPELVQIAANGKAHVLFR